MQQTQIDILSRKLLPQHLRVAAGVARYVGDLLHIGQSNQLHVGMSLEYGLEALQCCVNSAAQGRRGHQVDIGVIREGLLQLAALFVAEVCEKRVGDDMVFGAEVVNALYQPVVSSIEEELVGAIAGPRGVAPASA